LSTGRWGRGIKADKVNLAPRTPVSGQGYPTMSC